MSTFDAGEWLREDVVALAMEIYEAEGVTLVEAVQKAMAEQLAMLAYVMTWETKRLPPSVVTL